MRDLFSADNPFNQFMSLVFDLIILNFFFLITSIPIFTLGASTTALYTVLLKRARNNEGYIVRGYFKAFKVNFKQSIPLTLLYLAALFIVFADIRIVGSWEGSVGSMMYGFCIVLFFVVTAIFGYVWPLLAKFDNTTRNMLNNAWRLAFARLPWTLLMLLLNALPVILLMLGPDLFVKVIWIYFIVGFALVAYLICKILNPVFDKLVEPEE